MRRLGPPPVPAAPPGNRAGARCPCMKTLKDARPVEVLASVLASGSHEPGVQAPAGARRANRMAGVGPEDTGTGEAAVAFRILEEP